MDWQQRYVAGDTPWDKGMCSPGLKDLIQSKPVLFGDDARVFAPGCGFGHDVRELAKVSGFVQGADISEFAVARARKEAPENVAFDQLDIFDLPGSMHGSYEMVWEHTCFCAIAPEMRQQYVESMWQLLKPMGMVLGVFFVDPNRGFDGPPFLLQRDEVMAAFSSHFVLEWDEEAATSYPGREGRERLMLFRRLASCGE
ncbi:methyltransferase domain-containing protein [Rubritalea marina]|uniref:methyltransferase domain-containing protein n=1 Tax=Rubritalea marina TaxID=361055 RepID=UPI00035C79ED|nr:methyltransferase domain-containing protein [Rubritalea marina]